MNDREVIAMANNLIAISEHISMFHKDPITLITHATSMLADTKEKRENLLAFSNILKQAWLKTQ